MWEHCVTTIERDPMDLDRECDWVIKHKLIEGYRAKHDLPLTHPKVALIDLQYHDISRDRGLFYKLQDARPGRAHLHRRRHRRGRRDPAADHPGPPAGRVHPAGQGAQARLHGRLGAPEAQRPGPAHRAVQGPVPVARRAGREAHRVPVGAAGADLPHRPRSPSCSRSGRGSSASTPTAGGPTCSPSSPVRWRSATAWSLNTTAVDLGLGTGGWHVVHWNLARGRLVPSPGPGHIMKLRYTSLQVDTGGAEEQHPDAARRRSTACRWWCAGCTARCPRWWWRSARVAPRRRGSPT